jgi:hypothetical protein
MFTECSLNVAGAAKLVLYGGQPENDDDPVRTLSSVIIINKLNAKVVFYGGQPENDDDPVRTGGVAIRGRVAISMGT